MPDRRKPQPVERTGEDRVDLARAKMQTEMPDASKAASLHTMPKLLDMLLPDGIQAITTPWNGVYYRPGQVGDQFDADQMLAHELTHVAQNQRTGGGLQSLVQSLFNSSDHGRANPFEDEAYAAEDQRKAGMHDIKLPKDK